MHAACTGTEIAELLQPVLQTEPEQGTQIQLVAADTVERFPLPEQPLDRAVFDLVRGQRPPQTYRRLSQRQLDIRRIRREQGFLLVQLPCAVLIELVFEIKIRIARPPAGAGMRRVKRLQINGGKLRPVQRMVAAGDIKDIVLRADNFAVPAANALRCARRAHKLRLSAPCNVPAEQACGDPELKIFLIIIE